MTNDDTYQGARQAKIAMLRAAVEKRGYKFKSLNHSSGKWWLLLERQAGAIRTATFANLFGEKEFAVLFSCFDDDMAYAQMVHNLNEPVLANATLLPRASYNNAIERYAKACKLALGYEIEGMGGDATRQRLIATTAETDARRLYPELRDARNAYATYVMSAPATYADAAIYLANQPRIPESETEADRMRSYGLSLEWGIPPWEALDIIMRAKADGTGLRDAAEAIKREAATSGESVPPGMMRVVDAPIDWSKAQIDAVLLGDSDADVARALDVELGQREATR